MGEKKMLWSPLDTSKSFHLIRFSQHFFEIQEAKAEGYFINT